MSIAVVKSGAVMRVVSRKIRTLLALVVCMCFVPRALAADVCKEKPKIVTDEQKRISLVLPESARQSIHSSFPDLDVPGTTEMKGLWATETKPGTLPYFSSGDFNGDGHQDIALILMNAKELWLVVLHGEAGCTYSVGYKMGPYTNIAPQRVFLRTIPKGQEEVMSGNDKARYKFDTDAIELTIVDQSVGVFYWKNGKYQILDFGSE
jgi:hypothetical protein